VHDIIGWEKKGGDKFDSLIKHSLKTVSGGRGEKSKHKNLWKKGKKRHLPQKAKGGQMLVI